MQKIRLTLYITGQTARSNKAIAQIKRLMADAPHELVIVDVLEQPQAAEEAKIIATPTLIKSIPPPFRRLVGDLRDKEKVLSGLDVDLLEETDTCKGEPQ